MKTTRWIAYAAIFLAAGLWYVFNGSVAAAAFVAGVGSGVGLAIVYAYTDDTYFW